MTLDPNASEAAVKDEVKRLLRKYGAYWHMEVPGGFGVRGILDFWVKHKGRGLKIETKRAGVTTLSPFQERDAAAWIAAGGEVMVINARNLDELEDWLRD